MIILISERNIKISSDGNQSPDVDGDKSDNLPVEIKVPSTEGEVFSKTEEQKVEISLSFTNEIDFISTIGGRNQFSI